MVHKMSVSRQMIELFIYLKNDEFRGYAFLTLKYSSKEFIYLDILLY